jgi:GntR family transcriptional regulator/MocR family aminotransferase
VDLHLDLPGPRLRAGLESALRDAVRTGRLHPGARLPSSRALAQDLGIARNTVADAYGQLVAEGWLVARQGSGTRVAERAPAVEAAASAPAGEARPPRYDLRPGAPDLSAFPRATWLRATRRALNDAPDAALGYGDPRGRAELRQALSTYLARARGVRVTPDRLVVCSGFTQGLALICEALRGRGASTLAMEAYGLPTYRDVAEARGLRLTHLPVDAHGASVAELADAAAAVLTPAHQFPLGAPLAPARRGRAVEWAGATGGVIIEDDYDGEFRYDRQPVGAMQALAPEHVVYAGTASKTLAPGLRLGWLSPRRARRRRRRGQEPRRPANGHPRSAHPGSVHRLRRIRPARAPRAAGLPTPARPPHRRAATRRATRPDDRNRRRPARARRAPG